MQISFSHIVFAFVLYSMFGWFMETVLLSLIRKRFLNRGLLCGPWIPSYGLGAIFILLTSNMFPKQPVLVFIISAVIGTFVFYFMNWLLIQFFDTNLINITGKFSKPTYYILLHAILQGLFGLLIVYAVNPVLIKFVTEAVSRYSRLISGLLFALLGMDFLNSISGIANMRQRLEDLRKLMCELDSMPFSWYNNDDKIESINRLREICKIDDSNENHEIEKAILERIEHLQSQFYSGYRMLRAYPQICIAEYGVEISIFQDERELKQEAVRKSIPSFLTSLMTDTKIAWGSLSLSKLVGIFTVSSVAGYIVENVFAFAISGSLQGRQGMLYGPFSQVYGIGAIFLTFSLLPIAYDKNYQIFIFGGIMGGLLEAVLSYFQEIIFGSISWHYDSSKFPLFGGRTSMQYMVFWGLLSIAYIRVIFPWISGLIDRLQLKSNRFLTITIAIFLAFNITISSFAVFRWGERDKGIAPSNPIELWIDEKYPDNTMNEIYPNMNFVKNKP